MDEIIKSGILSESNMFLVIVCVFSMILKGEFVGAGKETNLSGL